MFSELMPLLAERTVLITVARDSGTTIRATVVPKRTSESENAALSTPLSFVGTPEELDCEFARELAAYVDTHRQLGSSLAQAKATMEAAAKAAQEEPSAWEDAKHSPTSYVQAALRRWLTLHGGEQVRENFSLNATITGSPDL